MSRKTTLLSQACKGVICYKQATGKSENTIADYRVTFKKLLDKIIIHRSTVQLALVVRRAFGDMVNCVEFGNLLFVFMLMSTV